MRQNLTWIIAAAAALCVVSPASADYTFLPGTPANGTTISYNAWTAAGRYVTFTVQPDPNYPCGAFNEYFIEINGQRTARVGDNTCSASIYLSTVGSYSWRVDLYIYNTATAVTGGTVSTLVIALPAPVASPATTTVPAVTAPNAQALRRSGKVGRKIYLAFHATGEEAIVGLVGNTAGDVLKRWTYRLQDFEGTNYFLWTPRRVGRYTFCVAATNAAGAKSSARCAAVTIS